MPSSSEKKTYSSSDRSKSGSERSASNKSDDLYTTNFAIPRIYLCILAFVASFPMAYAAWSEDARKKLSVSVLEMSAVGSVLFMAQLFHLIPGMMYDWYGPNVPCFYATVFHITAMVILTYSSFTNQMTVGSTATAMWFLGQASSTCNCLAMFIIAIMGPREEQGTRCGLASFCFAIGSAFWAHSYHWINDLRYYFVGVGFVCIIVVAFLYVLNPIGTYLKNDLINKRNSKSMFITNTARDEKTYEFLINRKFLMLCIFLSLNQAIIITIFCENVGTIGKSLGYEDTSVLPMVFAISDSTSRLLMGFFRDRAGDFPIQLISLSLVFLAFMIGMYDVTLIEWMLLCAGWGYGSLWATSIPALMEIPGGKDNIGIGVGIIGISVAAMVPVFSYLFGREYDKHAEVEVGKYSQCFGQSCFQLAFQACGVITILNIVMCNINNFMNEKKTELPSSLSSLRDKTDSKNTASYGTSDRKDRSKELRQTSNKKQDEKLKSYKTDGERNNRNENDEKKRAQL